MSLARIIAVGSLVFAASAAVTGCVFGGEDCNLGDEECVGTSGAYRVCTGGEGYYSWYDKQCPGVQPVCSSPSLAHISCEDAVEPPQCRPVSTLLDAGMAKLEGVVDLDGDGSVDLIFDSGVVAQSDGTGAFEKPQSLQLLTVGPIRQLLPAELNGDGVPDLAVMSDDPRELYAFLGSADKTYTFSERYFVSALDLQGAADFDGDGHDDLVAAIDQEVHVVSGLGDATITDRAIHVADPDPAYSTLQGVFIADFDAKPPLDLAVRKYGSLDIYLTRRDGSHVRAAALLGGRAVGDLDGDGRADVVSLDSDDSDSDRSALSIFRAGADAKFERSANLPIPYTASSIFVADFDGDQVNDVAAVLNRSPQALLQVFLGKGDGSFQAASLVSLSFDNNTRLFAADVDRDGKTDLVGQVGSQVLQLSGACVAR